MDEATTLPWQNAAALDAAEIDNVLRLEGQTEALAAADIYPGYGAAVD